MELDIGSIILGALVSAIVSIFIARHYSNRTKLYYISRVTSLFHPSPDSMPRQLKVLFEDREVNNLYRVDVALWNGGNTAIQKNDIIGSDAVNIELAGSKILEVLPIESSRDSLGISSVTLNENTISLEFDLMDKKDYLFINLLVEKDTTEKIECAINTEIIGLPEGIISAEHLNISSWNDVFAYLSMTGFFGIISFVTISITATSSASGGFVAISEFFINYVTIGMIINWLLILICFLFGLFTGLISLTGLGFLIFYRIILPKQIRVNLGIKSQLSTIKKAISNTSKEINK